LRGGPSSHEAVSRLTAVTGALLSFFLMTDQDQHNKIDNFLIGF